MMAVTAIALSALSIYPMFATGTTAATRSFARRHRNAGAAVVIRTSFLHRPREKLSPRHNILTMASRPLSCRGTSDDPDDGRERSSTAAAWLRSSLRLRDNAALSRAAALGPDGLAVFFVWDRDGTPATPGDAFGCAAAQELDRSLRVLRGNGAGAGLTVLRPAAGETGADAVAAAACALDLDAVAVDQDGPFHGEAGGTVAGAAEDLRVALARREDKDGSGVEIVPVPGCSLLMRPESAPRALGRNRNGGRILRWSTYLAGMKGWSHDSMDRTDGMPESLPPGTKVPADAFAAPDGLPEPTLAGRWARDLLKRWGPITEHEALQRAKSAGMRHGKNDDVKENNAEPIGEGGKTPPDSMLSPYLRWGLLSPRRAAHLGVRRRDLLWRDWSKTCRGVLGPLRRGDPVLPLLDGCCGAEAAPSLYGDTLEDSERAWQTGRTGSPLVDAGMRQLWMQGWMPRRIRLMSAACLVEGMGLDWRLGRDWFEHTLIDHDPDINEMMWQNAGLCGVDPFYRGLKWEADPSTPEEHAYVAQWSSQSLSEEIRWPPTLVKAAKRYLPHREEVRAIAEERRAALRRRGVYAAAGKVVARGVRVAWEGSDTSNTGAVPGEVLAVGREPIELVKFDIS